MFLVARVHHFGLELRHVDLARAVPRTALTADTEVEHLLGELVVGRVVREVAAHRLSKQVCPAARGLDLLVGGAVRRTHHPAGGVLPAATAPTAVAEFDHPLHPVLVVPVQRRLEARVVVVGVVVPEMLRHVVVATDVAGVEQPVGVEGGLEIAEGLPEVVAVQLPVPLRAGAAVAVFARDRAAELDDHVGHLVGDGDHVRAVGGGLRVDERADVQHARPGVGVERGVGVAVLLGEDTLEAFDVLGQLFRRDRTVLDKGDVFLVGGPREQDGESGLAERPELRPVGLVVGFQSLEGEGARIGCFRHSVGEEVRRLLAAVLVVLGVELDEQRGFCLRRDECRDVFELRGVASQPQENVVDEFDGRGVVVENVLDVGDGVEDALVEQQRDGLRLGDGFERHLGLGDDGEGPLATGHETCEVDGARLGLLDEHVEVVARDVALEFREPLADFVGLLIEDPDDLGVDTGEELVGVGVCFRAQRVDFGLTERRDRPVGEDDLTGLDVGVGLAVDERVRAGRVVADGPADDAPVPCRGVGRELQAVRGERRVEVVEDDARLDPRAAVVGVDVDDAVHVTAEIEDDRLVDRLPGEARAAAAREDGDPVVRTVGDDGRDIVGRLREDDADGRDLVRARVGRVQLARVGVEPDVASDTAVERVDEVGAFDVVGDVVVVDPLVACRTLVGRVL